MIKMEITTQEILNKQSDVIRKLMEENNHLKAVSVTKDEVYERELARIEREHQKEIDFLKSVIIAALDRLPAKRVTLFKDSPKDAEFALEPNISNDMIVILKSIL